MRPFTGIASRDSRNLGEIPGLCHKSEVIMAPDDRFPQEEWRPAVKAIICLRLRRIDFHLLLIAKTQRYGAACRLTIECQFNRILLVNSAKDGKSRACLRFLYSRSRGNHQQH